jgi:porin
MGAIASIKTAPITWTLMAFDPNDRTNDYWPDDLFDDGINLSLGATYVGKLAGRTTIYNLSGTYSTKDGANLGELLLPADLKTGNINGAYNVSFQFSHYLKQHSDRPGTGWGLFVKGALADGNPNPIQRSIIAGIGGKGLFPSRRDDTFGIGYFSYNFSDALHDSLNSRVNLDDEQGLEVFYNFALTPWFSIGGDLQVIDPALGSNHVAVIAGLRATASF